MKPLNALARSRRLRPSGRDVPAILLHSANATGPRPSAWHASAARSSDELAETGITILVWLVTILVLPAGAELAKLLSS